MTVQTVLRMGHPLLLQKAQKVDAFNTTELYTLIQDMEDTMTHMHGAGLAAPQIGVSLRVVIFGNKNEGGAEKPRYPDANDVPYTVLINPVIEPVSEEIEDGWEGCLSVPGMRGVVPRYSEVHYSGFNQFGEPINRSVNGFHARVVQHECDHLEGMLYPMQMPDLSTFGYIDELFPNQDIPDD